MLTFKLAKEQEAPLKMLCLGAHSDDIEIGCGGSVLKLINEQPDVEVTWIVLSSTRNRGQEARISAESFLQSAETKNVIIEKFRDGFFPYIGTEIKDWFETLKQKISPDLIFTHYRNDLHQDHRLVSELTWNTFRNHLILEYEIIKYDGDLGSPNFYIPLDEDICRKKIEIIFKCFKTQGYRKWFTEDVFYSMMRIRGVECNAPQKYAEAFYTKKSILK